MNMTNLEAANTLRLLVELGESDTDENDWELDGDDLKWAVLYAIDVLDPPKVQVQRLVKEIQQLKDQLRIELQLEKVDIFDD